MMDVDWRLLGTFGAPSEAWRSRDSSFRRTGRGGDRVAVSILTRFVRKALNAAAFYGLPGPAARIAEVLGRGSGSAGALMSGTAALIRMGRGVVPADVAGTVERLMSAAERPGVAVGEAAALVECAMRIGYHVARHRGRETSPILSDSGDPVTRRIVASPLLAVPPRRARPHRTPRNDGPVRLLVLTQVNTVFLDSDLARWSEDPGVDVRVLGPEDDATIRQAANLSTLVRCRLGGGRPPLSDRVAAELEAADVVYVEWAELFCAAVTLMPFDAPMVVRLHRYEALTPAPALMDWSRVSRLLTTEGSARLLERAAPDVTKGVDVVTAPLLVDTTPFARPKNPAARRTMAMVGYSQMVKDPMWALDVLDAVRAVDDAWRLILVGAADQWEAGPIAADYRSRFESRLIDEDAAVVPLGRREDVAEVLRDASVILSSSTYESTHVAVIEGVASGCLPVVRDWPDARPVGGAHATYPPEWIVVDPAEAAARILAASKDDASPADSAEASAAAQWLVENRDPAAIAATMDAAVLEWSRGE